MYGIPLEYILVYDFFTERGFSGCLYVMHMADEAPLTIDEIAQKLKCARGWVQLSLDAGCPVE